MVLIVVAWELGTDSRGLLLGEAMLPENRERVREVMASFPEVEDVLRLLTMHLGPNSALVNAEVHLVDGMETDQIEDLLERMTRAIRHEVPEVNQTFIELHPAGRTGGRPATARPLPVLWRRPGARLVREHDREETNERKDTRDGDTRLVCSGGLVSGALSVRAFAEGARS